MDAIMDAGTGLFEGVLRDLLVLLKLSAAGPGASGADLARELRELLDGCAFV